MLWSLALVPIVAGAVLLTGVRSRLWLGAAAANALAMTLVLSIVAATQGWTGHLAWSESLQLTSALTPLSAAMAILVPTIALPVSVYAAAHEHRPGLARLVALLLVFVGAMELLVVADDLLTLLIGWELVGACSWALISHDWRDADNPRAGLYAFAATRLGDLGLFIAAMTTFAASGSFAYDTLPDLDRDSLAIVAFGVLLSAAAKAGQVPFSPWLFRAMAGPTSASALLHAATMVAAGVYLLARLHPMLGDVPGFAAATIATGLATALAGGAVALLQNHAKRLLAASTSAHFGLMFVAVGAGYPGVAILHLVAHAGFKALLFLAAGAAGDRAGSYALDRMQVGRALPAMAVLCAVGTLALAGVPPLDAGWTKEAVISAASHRDKLLAAACMVAGGLSAAYAVRFQLLAYGFAGDALAGERPAAAAYAAIGALALFSLLLSALWLPAVHGAAGRLLGTEIPPSKTTELLLSLLLVGLGLLVGLFLARHCRSLGAAGRAKAVAAWLGLPWLIDACVVRPFERTAHAAAWCDDRGLDAGLRGIAGLAQAGARATALSDDRILDAGRRGVAGLAQASAMLLARQDRHVVDRGVAWTAAFTEWLAHVGERVGERLTDGLPEGSAAIVGMSGRDARRLQTGLSHHYFALLALGAAVMSAIVVAAS